MSDVSLEKRLRSVFYNIPAVSFDSIKVCSVLKRKTIEELRVSAKKISRICKRYQDQGVCPYSLESAILKELVEPKEEDEQK